MINLQKCVQCDKDVKNIKSFHLDHIKPLANGGNNEINNIQMLCIPCHLDKTNCENEQGYVKLAVRNQVLIMKLEIYFLQINTVPMLSLIIILMM